MKINNLQILGHNYNLNNFNPEDVEFINRCKDKIKKISTIYIIKDK